MLCRPAATHQALLAERRSRINARANPGVQVMHCVVAAPLSLAHLLLICSFNAFRSTAQLPCFSACHNLHVQIRCRGASCFSTIAGRFIWVACSQRAAASEACCWHCRRSATSTAGWARWSLTSSSASTGARAASGARCRTCPHFPASSAGLFAPKFQVNVFPLFLEAHLQ